MTQEQPNSDILLPCPFCGSRCVNDTSEPIEETNDQWACPDCCAAGPLAIGADAATKAWNTRLIRKTNESRLTHE